MRVSLPVALAICFCVSTPIVSSAQGVIPIPGKIEVENYSSFSDVTPGNSGGGCRTDDVDLDAPTFDQPDLSTNCELRSTEVGEWLGFTILVAQSDTYVLSVRLEPYSQDTTGGGTFHVEIDDVNVSGPMRVPKTEDGWWTTMFMPGIALTAGQHILKLKMDTLGPNSGHVGFFNYLALTKSAPFGGIATTVPGVVEAENFDVNPSGAPGETFAYHDTGADNAGDANYRPGEGVDIWHNGGSGYNVIFSTKGEWMGYSISAVETGVYKIGARLSYPYAGATIHFEIDGVDVTGPVSVPGSGWGNFQTVWTRGFFMRAGVHMLYVVADTVSADGSVAQIDNLTFVDPPACTPGAPYTEREIQNCLDQGGTTTLMNGQTYAINSTIRMRANVTLTDVGGGALPILQATPNLTTANGGLTLVADNIDGFTISNLIIDGNKANRPPTDCGNFGGSSYEYGKNLRLIGNNFTLTNITVKNAVCGSNAEVQGSGYQITYSVFADGGYPAMQSGGGGPWSDGLTLWSCNSAYINHNQFSNNTDVDLIDGGGSNCIIELNNIWNDSVHAFGGLMVGYFIQGGGNHEGSIFRNNCIVGGVIARPDDYVSGCSFYQAMDDKLAFGLMVGNEPWWNEAAGYQAYVGNAGTVTNNSIRSAVVNLAIDGIAAGDIENNSTGDHRSGPLYFNQLSEQGGPPFGFFCPLSAEYSAHLYGSATIQAGWEPYWFFNTKCSTWNTSKPQPDNVGAIPHGRSLTQGQSKTSPNGRYQLVYQGDGNLVLYDLNTPGEAPWSEPGPVGNPQQAVMQEDANFVVYDGPCTWATNTSDANNKGAYLVVTDDANVSLLFLDGTVLWDRWMNTNHGCQ